MIPKHPAHAIAVTFVGSIAAIHHISHLLKRVDNCRKRSNKTPKRLRYLIQLPQIERTDEKRATLPHSTNSSSHSDFKQGKYSNVDKTPTKIGRTSTL